MLTDNQMVPFMRGVIGMARCKLTPEQNKKLDGLSLKYLDFDPIWYPSTLGDATSNTKLKEVRLFKDGLQHAVDQDLPLIRVAAFTTIHECGHIIAAKNRRNEDDHENPEWAAVCQRMGIAEERYSLKGPDWEYGFHFRDMELWGRIQDFAARLP